MENQENNVIDLRAIVGKVLQKWYWFVISCAIVGALGLLYYFSTTPKYIVDAQVKLRDDGAASAFAGVEVLQFMGMGGSKSTEDEIALMTSRDILMQVVRELDIQTTYRIKKGLRWEGQYAAERDLKIVYPPMFLDTTITGVRVSLKVRKSDYVVRLKYKRFHSEKFVVKDLTRPIPTEIGPVRFEVRRPLDAGAKYRMYTPCILRLVDAYAKQISVAPLKKGSQIIKLSTVTDETEKLLDFIKKQVELYNLDAILDKKVMAEATDNFIGERLTLIEQELADAEENVEQYKKDNNLTSVSVEAEIYVTESTELRHRLDGLETQMKLVDYVEQFVKDDSKQDQLIPANLGIEDEALSGLITSYDNLALRRIRMERTATADNPVIIQLESQMELMRKNILASIQSVKNSLNIRKADLEALNRAANKRIASLPTQEREYIEVARNKELRQKLYIFLYQKREENALSLVSAVSPAKVVTTAQINPKRQSPRMRNVALVCLILGLGFPCGLLYLIEIFNDKISDRKQFERLIKVPFIGQIINDHAGKNIVIGSGNDSTPAELFRLLRTNIGFVTPDKKCPVLLVTSCIDNEGKTYIASNLAVSLSLLGKNVAIVGLDVRKPCLAAQFGLADRGRLTSYLDSDSCGIDDLIVQSTTYKGLSIIPAGDVPINPSELLQNERLDQLFTALRKQFDFIIVDSAPVAMVSDTFIINRVCDFTLFVSRIGYTTDEMIAYINDLHTNERLNNVVSVLNGVELKGANFGYSYGYAKR